MTASPYPSAARGRSIRLFLPDGNPKGVMTAEIPNWTGKAIVAPRTRLPDLLARAEATQTGLYLLLGGDPDQPGRMLAYVGEGDNVGNRLRLHAKDDAKGFFEHACIIVSKDTNLTKGHVRYLESRMIAMATQAGRTALTNGTAPDVRHLLPEADLADMDYFISQLQLLLPTLGINILQPPPQKRAPAEDQPAAPASDEATHSFELRHKKQVLATGRVSDDGFVVEAGSRALARLTSGAAESVRNRREALKEDGGLTSAEDGDTLRFTRDVEFTSPSGASGLVLGRSSNGWREWRHAGTQMPYADWQDKQIAGAATDIPNENT